MIPWDYKTQSQQEQEKELAALREENARLRDDLHIKTAEWTTMMEENVRLRERLKQWESQDIHEAMECHQETERLTREREEARAEAARHKRNAECYACEAGDPGMDGVEDTKLSRAEAELARCRDERDKQHARAMLAEAEVKRLEGLILDADTITHWYLARCSGPVPQEAIRVQAEARRIRAARSGKP